MMMAYYLPYGISMINTIKVLIIKNLLKKFNSNTLKL